MKHSESSTTHWACQERLEEFGGETTCCGCIEHECKNNQDAVNIC